MATQVQYECPRGRCTCDQLLQQVPTGLQTDWCEADQGAVSFDQQSRPYICGKVSLSGKQRTVAICLFAIPAGVRTLKFCLLAAACGHTLPAAGHLLRHQ
jgi:hypothetical protein